MRECQKNRGSSAKQKIKLQKSSTVGHNSIYIHSHIYIWVFLQYEDIEIYSKMCKLKGWRCLTRKNWEDPIQGFDGICFEAQMCNVHCTTLPACQTWWWGWWWWWWGWLLWWSRWSWLCYPWLWRGLDKDEDNYPYNFTQSSSFTESTNKQCMYQFLFLSVWKPSCVQIIYEYGSKRK